MSFKGLDLSRGFEQYADLLRSADQQRRQMDIQAQQRAFQNKLESQKGEALYGNIPYSVPGAPSQVGAQQTSGPMGPLSAVPPQQNMGQMPPGDFSSGGDFSSDDDEDFSGDRSPDSEAVPPERAPALQPPGQFIQQNIPPGMYSTAYGPQGQPGPSASDMIQALMNNPRAYDENGDLKREVANRVATLQNIDLQNQRMRRPSIVDMLLAKSYGLEAQGEQNKNRLQNQQDIAKIHADAMRDAARIRAASMHQRQAVAPPTIQQKLAMQNLVNLEKARTNLPSVLADPMKRRGFERTYNLKGPALLQAMQKEIDDQIASHQSLLNGGAPMIPQNPSMAMPKAPPVITPPTPIHANSSAAASNPAALIDQLAQKLLSKQKATGLDDARTKAEKILRDAGHIQ